MTVGELPLLGQLEVVAPPLASVQSRALVPLTVPAVNSFVSVPCVPVCAVPPLMVRLVFAVIVVPVIAAGVPPPIAPGFGREEVEPPSDTDVPAMVMAEFDRAAFATEEQVGAATALMAVMT